MLSRRDFLLSLAAAGALAILPGGGLRAAEVAPPVLTDDGLYFEPWFIESFLELGEDLNSAASRGRRFAIMWELRGCPYCKETHFVNFADPTINRFVRENFDILQLNIIGARQVTDFDGEVLAESDLAAKYGVKFAPTFQFFPDSDAGLVERKPQAREVARMPGYFKPPHFLAMFQFVQEKAYEQTNFRTYLNQAKSVKSLY